MVLKGQKVKKGEVLCQGYGTEGGELALGRNMMVAFMPWQGYNFEDAIVISEKVVREDIFTSIHIEEFELEVRDTKRGEEELTAEIPNVSEETVRNLDENGIIRMGTEVKEGDILIGKITPKGESDPTPEEKLLRAIFGDKAGDVKDASKKAPPSMKGVVIDTKLFSRPTKEERAKHKEDLKGLMKRYSRDESQYSVPEEVNLIGDILTDSWTDDADVNRRVFRLVRNYLGQRSELMGQFKRERFALEVGDELPAGIVKLAKVYIAKKRKMERPWILY